MPRFFVEPEFIKDSSITICGDDARHISSVLRCKVGEKITVCNGCAEEYECEIMSLDSSSAELHILEKFVSNCEPKVKITLFQGIPKSDKMELIIQKCVELGVYKIVPVDTERTVSKLDKKDKEKKKIERWQKISEAAAKQCGRGIIPQIGEVMSFSKALELAKTLDNAIIPYELEEKNTLKEILYSLNKCEENSTLGVFIGPEGGFSFDEIEKAKEGGVISITLGKRILRTETAGMMTIAIVLYELG